VKRLKQKKARNIFFCEEAEIGSKATACLSLNHKKDSLAQAIVCYDKSMSATPKRQIIVNTFGTFGYISLILQWLWVSVLFLPQLFENETVKDFFMPPANITQAPSIELHAPPLLATVLAIAITVAILIITIVILARLPIAVSKTGKKTVLSTAERIIPVITHHQKLPAKKKRQLTVQIIRIVKFVFTLLPFLLLVLVVFVPTSLPDEIVMFIGGFLALCTLLWFSLEYGLAKILRIEESNLV